MNVCQGGSGLIESEKEQRHMTRKGFCALMMTVGLGVSACAERSALVATSQEAASPPTEDISGFYDVNATRWNGTKSTSRLLIKSLGIEGTAWQLVDVNRPRQSLALRSGDVLGTAYTTQSTPSDFASYFGIAIYEMRDATLHGQWLSSANPTTIEREVMSCPENLIGECNGIDGKSPGQATKDRRIVIKRSHSGYWLNWIASDPRDNVFGVGIVHGNKVIVAFGRDIFPAVEVCRISGVMLRCRSSDGDLRYINKAVLTRSSS
ncbi:MAG: hypothetical protein HC869_14895 [Rhodospirillales bacterium]|nr:hypothetical protein [Rhodospirillales bacterium]